MAIANVLAPGYICVPDPRRVAWSLHSARKRVEFAPSILILHTDEQEFIRTMSSIEDRVKKIVAEQLGVKEEEIQNSASFVEDLGADSLDTVELVMALEEEFEAEIPDEEAEQITTVQAAIDYIQQHVNK